jgi:decaprenylphospho-beta-D-erythro-pentofuranosid-2-ulose 2-reductase
MRIAVYGATSDIAVACMKIWAARGDSLQLFSRNGEKQAIVAAELRQRWQAEVSEDLFDADDFESIHGAAATLKERLQKKEGGIDLLFIAFGYLGENAKSLHVAAEASLITGVNYTATVDLLTALMPVLEEQRGAQIAVISSVAGERGRAGLVVYGAAKAGVTAYLEGLRGWLYRYGVGVTIIKPGIIRTAMTDHLPASRLISSPEKIAPAIVRAIDRKQNKIYVPRFWWLIMLIVRLLPEWAMKRISK